MRAVIPTLLAVREVEADLTLHGTAKAGEFLVVVHLVDAGGRRIPTDAVSLPVVADRLPLPGILLPSVSGVTNVTLRFQTSSPAATVQLELVDWRQETTAALGLSVQNVHWRAESANGVHAAGLLEEGDWE